MRGLSPTTPAGANPPTSIREGAEGQSLDRCEPPGLTTRIPLMPDIHGRSGARIAPIDVERIAIVPGADPIQPITQCVDVPPLAGFARVGAYVDVRMVHRRAAIHLQHLIRVA